LTWRIELTAQARKQLSKLDRNAAHRILKYLRRIEHLENPRQPGKALHGQLAELWRYRVGDYRLICEIRDDLLLVLVVRIGHRKKIYG
jgi:mRNA interferase RelE/StbE